MATVATTTAANPFQYPAETLVDWQIQAPPYTSGNNTGHLYAMVASTTANQYDVYRSTNNGGSWSLRTSRTRASIADVGCIHINRAGFLTWIYRTNESSQDRVYHRRYDSANDTWSAELLLHSASNGGVAGAALGGMDYSDVSYQSLWITGFAAIGATIGGKHALVLSGVTAGPGVAPYLNQNTFAGPRIWSTNTGTGRITPSVDMEHAADGKNSTWPNMWVTFGRTQLWVLKLSWTGAGWTTPSAPTAMSSSFAARDSVPARWTGSRLMAARLNGDSTCVVYERNRANTSTTERSTPTHPQGVIRSMGLGYNSITQDVRVYGVGTSDSTLYYVDYVRASATWSGWSQVSATAILGAGVDNYQIRRGSAFNNKVDVLLAHATPTPNTIVNTQLSLAYAPFAPTWDLSAGTYTDGGASDVAASLLLNWTFNDPDTVNDAQTAYALSRQIGVDPVEYWRASDSTWQATEQKNTSATTQVTLPGGFVDRFDGGVAGAWTPSNSTFVASTAQSRSGGTSALLTSVGTPLVASAHYVEFPVTPTTSYSAELWGYSVAGYSAFLATINWYTSGHVYISTSSSPSSALAAGVWGRRSITAAAPGTAAYATVGPTIGASPPAATAVYVDDVSFGATPTPWAAATDAAHAYRVKTWDATDVASVYSAALTVIPSTQVNPTITFPPDSGTVNEARVTVTWTVAEQTAFRVALYIFGVVQSDSGKIQSTATSYEIPMDVVPFNWSVIVWTWNSEGLVSSPVQSNFAVVFVAPPAPTLTVTPLPASGIMRVAIANPDPAVYVDDGTAANADNATVVPALPTGLAVTDLLLELAAIRNSGTGTPNTPAGYAVVVAFANMAIFAKAASSSEAAPSQSFTGGVAGATTSAQTAAFTRAGTTVLGTPATQLNGSAQNIAYPGLTPGSDDCIILLAVWKQSVNTGMTTPAGFTPIANTSSALGSGQSMAWYFQIQTAATAISSGTITVSGGVSAISRAVVAAVSGVPPVTANSLFRRIVGTVDSVPVGTDIAPDGSVDDWRVLSGVPYEYQAVAVGANRTSSQGAWTP